ncbi:MAG: DUF4148 domain-containing protein [Rhodoferax sp.]
MNATKIFAATTFAAVASFAALAAVGAHAGEAAGRADYAAQNVSSFHSTRTVADVRAEAAQAARNYYSEPAGSRVAVIVNSGIDRAAVRQETAIALRAGQIPHGEASVM